MQRTRAEQISAGRPGARHWVARGAMLLGFGLVVAVIAVLSLRFVRRPALAGECVQRYARARTAAETSLVDAVAIPRKDPSFQTCGSQRAAVERGLAF